MYMVFDCIKFILQFSISNMSQTWFSADYLQSVLVFLSFSQNLVTFLQINFIDNFVCTMSTHPDVSEGARLGRKGYISSFQKPTHFQTQRTQIVGATRRTTEIIANSIYGILCAPPKPLNLNNERPPATALWRLARLWTKYKARTVRETPFALRFNSLVSQITTPIYMLSVGSLYLMVPLVVAVGQHVAPSGVSGVKMTQHNTRW